MVHDIRQEHSVRHFMGPYLAGDTLDICGETLLAGSYRSHDPIELYDINTGECMETFQWNEDDDKKGGMIMSAQYGVPKTDTILAGSSSAHELKLFDTKNGHELAKVTGFSGPVIAIHMDHQGKTVAIGTKNGSTVLLHHGKEDEEEAS